MRRLYPATLLVSAAAIGYEILLMRVLSIVQWHHFAWMIISLALLGYGASGTFIALAKRYLVPRFAFVFALSAALFSIAIVVAYVVAQRVPFNALEVIWDPGQLAGLALIYLVFFVPFFFAAVCIGLAFTCRQEHASRIYFFDLLGAGLGAAAAIVSLFYMTPQSALQVLAVLALGGSLLVAVGSRPGRLVAIGGLVWLGVLALGPPDAWLGLRMSDYKGLSQALQVTGSRATAIRSGPLGLLTAVESPRVPFRHAPGLSFATQHVPPEQVAIFTDGDAMSVINRYDGDCDEQAYLRDVTAALPFALLDAPNVLVLGAGGGTDVLMALCHGASRVAAVELNPQMTGFVTGRYADFAGQLYDSPRVTLHHAEARSFVAGSDAHYDLIHIGLLDSFAAAGAGVQALNESYLYTVEALEQFIAHLEPGGVLAVTRWLKLPPRDSLKLAATAVRALRARGVSEPGRHLAMIRSWNTATLLVSESVLTPADIAAIREFARSRSFDTAWFPGMDADSANRYNLLDEPWLFRGIDALRGDGAADFIERYRFDIEPATDNRPYFFNTFRRDAWDDLATMQRQGAAGQVEWGYLVLLATVAQAALAGFLLILLPLMRIRREWPPGTGRRAGGYFFLLGLAFLFVEMALIQKFTLYLGDPLYSVAVVLAGFLVFAGIGSALAPALRRRLERSRIPVLPAVVGAIAVVSIGYLLLLPPVFAATIGLPDTARVVIAVLLLAPPAVLMGMPFPLGLARLAERAPAFIPWAWGLNGFASVLSAGLATLLAIEFGFNAVVLLALLLYGAAAAALPADREKGRSAQAVPAHASLRGGIGRGPNVRLRR